ncbi:unnamed protein product [Parascedosporium putredinis]|uniref:Casein kinase substrate phosphoprotein PP28 domain-containing protein n=1 Tax=Parascedosporium putredinis TaxID=1442378 RepID=A0A9P1H3F0_9PEZI|nr:unnamed protein product [Parascedosporium putredinis]CAI7994671.1 unnamed protein product [Parascedosporium putredinis]
MARAGAGAPGSNSRGRGGKFRKFTRGGGKHFSRDLRPQDENGNEISMWSEDAQRHIASLSDETGSDESDEGSDEDGNKALSREDRKKEKKARKEAAIARKNAQAVEEGQESADAQAAKERYRALHEQGKTDEAKSDLARLKLIREQREAEAARRKAEKEEKDAQEAARKGDLNAKLASIEAKKVGKKLK